VVATLPSTLPAAGGAVTVLGTNFGGDSSYIFVLVDGKPQACHHLNPFGVSILVDELSFINAPDGSTPSLAVVRVTSENARLRCTFEGLCPPMG